MPLIKGSEFQKGEYELVFHIGEYFKKYFTGGIHSLTEEYDIIEQISSTAEHAFTLMTSLIRNVPKSFQETKVGNDGKYNFFWKAKWKYFCFFPGPV